MGLPMTAFCGSNSVVFWWFCHSPPLRKDITCRFPLGDVGIVMSGCSYDFQVAMITTFVTLRFTSLRYSWLRRSRYAAAEQILVFLMGGARAPLYWINAVLYSYCFDMRSGYQEFQCHVALPGPHRLYGGGNESRIRSDSHITCSIFF